MAQFCVNFMGEQFQPKQEIQQINTYNIIFTELKNLFISKI